MTLGQKISSARKALSWTQNDLVEAMKKAGVPVTYPWVASVETDRIKEIKPEIRRALAKLFHKPENYFLEIDYSQLRNPMLENNRNRELMTADSSGSERLQSVQLIPTQLHTESKIPFFGAICAGGTSLTFDDAYAEYYLPISIPSPKGRRVGAWEGRGDCMDDGSEDAIRNGDIVIVLEQRDPESGKTVAALVNGELTLKKIIKSKDGEIELKPKNPKHKPIIIKTEHFQVQGVVIWSVRRH